MRLLKNIKVGPSCGVKIYRKAETNEFVVQTIVDGQVEGGKRDGGYFTDDKRDSRSTAAHQVRRLKKLPSCRVVR